MYNCSIAEILVIVAMPFLYGAATRLPFIYFVIHLDNHFELEWLTIGIYVACYQGSRVVTSAVSIVAPKTSHLFGTCAGLAGYITVFLCNKDDVAPFAIGTAIVGFSETISSMQKYAKEMYKFDPDRKKAQLMLKFQYASVMLGVVFAFSIGGFVYQYKKINGVALFGIIIELLALLVFIVFVRVMGSSSVAGEGEEIKVPPVLIKNPSSKDKDEDFVDNPLCIGSKGEKKDEEDQVAEDGTRKETAQNSIAQRTSITDRLRLSILINASNTTYSTCDLNTTWVNWLLCVSFGIEALTIGYNLSIGPIFLLNEFRQGTGIIGILFAVGAASGTVAAIGVTCTTFGNNCMRSIAASPYDLCFVMGGIAVGVIVSAVPNFVVHVIGLVLLMCFNDLGATMMTELQASITTVSNYSLLGPLGQVVRRCLNVITALTGPVFFGIYPRLPYFVAGSITLLWAIMLSIAFKLRMEKTVKKVAMKTGQTRKSVKDRMSFSTTEIVHSIAIRK